MKNGFIYPFIKGLINCFYVLNIVEWWKEIYIAIRRTSRENLIKSYNEAIDLFIFFKYLFLIYLYIKVDSKKYMYLVTYLIISNIFTYFYYHVWEKKEGVCRERDQRRFISLMLSILYSNICFGYLYKVSISNFEPFLEKIPLNLKTIYASFMTSFGSTLNPVTENGFLLIFLNVTINMLFIVIILSNTSIPDVKKDEVNNIK